LQVDRITNVYIDGVIHHGYSRSTLNIPIPGGMAQYFSRGTETPTLNLTGFLNGTDAATKMLQLQEIAENPDWPVSYLDFDPMESAHSGWYVIERVEGSREHWMDTYAAFTLQARRVGLPNQTRWATFYDTNASAEEPYSGWGGLTTHKMVSLPNGVTSVADSVYATRLTSDGTAPIILDPTRPLITYASSTKLSNWYLSECRIYDTVTTGNTTENTWVQVFSPYHPFTGDVVIQNGLLRYKYVTTGTFYVWDATTTSAWVSIGVFKTALTGNLDATVKHFQVTKLTPDEIRWTEIRQNGINPITVKYVLRRGAYHCRVEITTQSLGIDTGTYVQLQQNSFYAQLFNSQASGAAGGGDLALDTALNYECGYNATNSIIAGFVLRNQPAKQPFDPGAAGNYLPVSITIGANDVRTFFIVGWSQGTGAGAAISTKWNNFVFGGAVWGGVPAVNLTTARTMAQNVAQQAMYNIDQKLVIPDKAFL
jgi:hypothetical protein